MSDANFPRCFRCGKPDGILDADVSTVRVVRGEGFTLFACMLCKKCEREVLEMVWKALA